MNILNRHSERNEVERGTHPSNRHSERNEVERGTHPSNRHSERKEVERGISFKISRFLRILPTGIRRNDVKIINQPRSGI